MKTNYTKINYSIIGRYPNGRKYGITTRFEISGYSVEDLDGIAVSKRGGWWYVDHLPTGMGIVTIGCKTRDAAVEEYKNNYMERVHGMDLRSAVELFNNTPSESEVASWEMVNYCTTKNYRFDRVTNTAKSAGLIIKKADDNTYLDGGNINIIGKPEDLEAIREMIKAWEQHDAETEQRAEIISDDDQEAEPAAEIASAEEINTEDASRDPKTARGPVPEKTFSGKNIQGDGWMIFFDNATERTRVIFTEKPSKKILRLVKDAGFYWCKTMGSWNRKLTWKAYRAALELAWALDPSGDAVQSFI